MTDSNFDMFDPRTMLMDSNCSHEDGCDHRDFSFAFDDINFSDRVLRIYIFSDLAEVRVKTLHISSPILAARSPFFYKLFSNGMRESKQYHATVQINVSEEAAFMELLKFMYNNNLTVTTARAVLDVLVTADKFDVASCITHCSHLLKNLPMTPESVLVYLDLPSTIVMSNAFLPLTVATKQFYVVHYKDLTKYEDEILGLSLAGVEAIIASNDLQVTSEDEVYNFVLKWAQAKYPNFKDRGVVIRTRLAKFIRYPYLTYRKLQEVLTCKELDPVFARKVVTEANSFKAEVPHKQHTYIIDENSHLDRRFVERAYKHRPIKIVKFEEPHPRLALYLDLKRDMCESLFPSGKFFSEEFNMGGHMCYLHGHCGTLQHNPAHNIFRFFFAIHEKEADYFVFDYEFGARSKPAETLVHKMRGKYACTGRKKVGFIYLFGIPWTLLIGPTNFYFTDDVFHLKVELTYRCLETNNK